jgi:hypothetical protein
VHWYFASEIAQSRDRQLEREAETRRHIRDGAARRPAPAADRQGTVHVSPPTPAASDERPECRSDAA